MPKTPDDMKPAPRDGGDPGSPMMKVVRLERRPDEKKTNGRPRKLKYPPLPAEIYDSMTELEREHFEFFIEAIKADNQLRPSDYIGLYAAGLEYIAYLRLQASQIASGQLVTMSRQHPGVQLRAWLDTMSFSRRKGVSGKQAEDGLASQLMALSS